MRYKKREKEREREREYAIAILRNAEAKEIEEMTDRFEKKSKTQSYLQQALQAEIAEIVIRPNTEGFLQSIFRPDTTDYKARFDELNRRLVAIEKARWKEIQPIKAKFEAYRKDISQHLK